MNHSGIQVDLRNGPFECDDVSASRSALDLCSPVLRDLPRDKIEIPPEFSVEQVDLFLKFIHISLDHNTYPEHAGHQEADDEYGRHAEGVEQPAYYF